MEGKVRAAVATELAPEVTAQVVERSVEPGDKVARGQPLLRLDDTLFAAEVLAREAELAAARSDAEAAGQTRLFQDSVTERDRVLFEGGGISLEALERSEATLVKTKAAETAAQMRVQATEQALRAAREQLSKTTLKAPWPGAVVEVTLSEGDLAQNGRPAVRLVRDGSYRVVAQLPQEANRSLRPGTAAWIEWNHQRVQAPVSRIAAGLDRSGLAAVEVDLSEPPFGLSDGASVRLSLVLESGEGTVVPKQSLLEGQQGRFVFRVSEGRVEVLPVRILLRGADQTLVEGPLVDGDHVVVEHPSILMTLSDGTPVREFQEKRKGEGS
jgi:RND family efflux transporter MFP subunit